MRRGAPINSKKPAVMADVDDIEGGGGYRPTPPGSGNNSVGNFNSASSSMDVSGSGSERVGLINNPYPMPYDSTGKAKQRRVYHCHGYQSFLVGAAGSMSDSLLQKCIALLVGVVVIGVMVFPLQMRVIWLVYGAVTFGAMVSMWLSKNVLSCDDGTKEMRAVVRL